MKIIYPLMAFLLPVAIKKKIKAFASPPYHSAEPSEIFHAVGTILKNDLYCICSCTGKWGIRAAAAA